MSPRAMSARVGILVATVCFVPIPVAWGEELNGGALDGQRPRVIVSTDVGGSDPDDFQSMVHLLLYADVLDIEGLIASPPGKGRARDLLECLAAYEKDYPQLKKASARYPTPESLRKVVVQGASEPAPHQGYSKPTAGSRWLITRAKAKDIGNNRPLWVLVWGSLTDVAQAIHDDPSIKKHIRVYSIGSWNTRQDRAARRYLYDHHKDLWWIESDTTFRGMYRGGEQGGDLGNRTFVERHVRGRGALGNLFYQKKRDIKMGDTPSLLYLLRGNTDDPTTPHWGGAFVQPDAHTRPHYWHDRKKSPRDTVNRWRRQYLRHWQKRLAFLKDSVKRKSP